MINPTISFFSSLFTGLKAIMPEWWPILTGLMVLYTPTFYGLFNGLWATEEQLHGPIIFTLSIWLIYQKWPRLLEIKIDKFSAIVGWIFFVIALIFYLVGHSQYIYIFEVGSFICLLAAILLIKIGFSALKAMWFPLFFMLFMIPLPGTLLIMFTMPMKMAISYMAESILFLANYPIARNGVILQIGQYQLLVADACAGLHTFFTLEALGLFYLNIVHHTSVFRNVMLAILIAPISFIANVIRVISLTLVTYYMGEANGQGFLHGFAGIVLFLSALLLILALDRLLQLAANTRNIYAKHQAGAKS